ncbi:related to ATP-dependent rRNA helicase SPB4 [Hanseniaspora guilliermondii]|uniref:ATP-dependent RNA helicase n=1 Tax=Hanseniaspora guilliermondii TaxID=56406 RepID=A0A1L0FEF7_9ASCO|nr:related to ATP-dependent rRNA helicase SPB4 [Hanseniaspora guilliermondii]
MTSKESLSWDNLDYTLLPFIKRAIEAYDFEHLTPVQAMTIPMLSSNRKDVIVESYTGSGKTLSYVIPILERCVRDYAFEELKDTDLSHNGPKLKKPINNSFHTMIIVPTRDLAVQVEKVIDFILSFYNDKAIIVDDEENKETLYNAPKTMLLVGGDKKQNMNEDIYKYKTTKPHILIGTPGRVLEFLKKPIVNTKECAYLILDECDRLLLDPSFDKDIQQILSILPKQKRTGLFSATIKDPKFLVSKTSMRNPFKITVNALNKPKELTLKYVLTKTNNKLNQLLAILQKSEYKKCIVYMSSANEVTFFHKMINHFIRSAKDNKLFYKFPSGKELPIYSMSGKLTNQQREKSLELFKKDTVSGKSVLLTTDLTSRGIDITDVDLVVHFDAPTTPEIFLHRSGRSARGGKAGNALLFLQEDTKEIGYLDFLKIRYGIDLEEIYCNFDIDGYYDMKQLYRWVLEDRLRFDESVSGFVSYINGYRAHSLKSIFKTNSINYLKLAELFGCIRFPKSPEVDAFLKDYEKLDCYFDEEQRKHISDIKEKNGWFVDEFNMNQFKYLDKVREQKRLKDLEESQMNKKSKSKKPVETLAWSNKIESKEKKQERKKKLVEKRELIVQEMKRKAKEDAENGINSEYNDDIDEDWKEMVRSSKKQKKSNDFFDEM